jgi:chromosome segregation ATPase
MKYKTAIWLKAILGLAMGLAAIVRAGDAPDSSAIMGEQYWNVTGNIRNLNGQIERQRRNLDSLAVEISRLKQEKKNSLFGKTELDRKLKVSQGLALKLDSLEREARRWDDSLAVLRAAERTTDTLLTSNQVPPPSDTLRVAECRAALEKVRYLILKKKQEREEAARAARQQEEQVQFLEKTLLFIGRTEQIENDDRGYLKTREDYANELEFLKRRLTEQKDAEANAAQELKKLEQEEMRLVKMLGKLP